MLVIEIFKPLSLAHITRVTWIQAAFLLTESSRFIVHVQIRLIVNICESVSNRPGYRDLTGSTQPSRDKGNIPLWSTMAVRISRISALVSE